MQTSDALLTLQNLLLAVQVIIGFVTLVVLIFYALDNRRIAQSSVRQSEELQKPFLALVNGEDTDYVLKNQGKGAAINIRYDGFSPEGDHLDRYAKPLGVNETRPLNSFNKKQLEKSDFTVSYESLSGAKYATRVIRSRKPNEGYEVKFIELSRKSG